MKAFPALALPALALWLLACCGAASAQALPPGVQLGMGVDALRQVLPALDPVRRPQRLAGGVVGSWQLPGAQVAGLMGVQTFFFAGNVLRRVEFLADTQGLADGGAGAFDAVLAWGREVFGVERAARDAVSRYAGWSSSQVDAYVRLGGGGQGGLRVVFSARLARDDRAL